MARIPLHRPAGRAAALLAALCTLLGPAARAGAAPAAARPGADIPDSATFLTYSAPRFRVDYIEGWGRQGGGASVTFSDKDSLERVALLAAPRGGLGAFVRGPEVSGLRRAGATGIGGIRPVGLPGGRGWYLRYTIASAPDQVTGKVVPLVADRYYLAGPHGLAALTLASPAGDDNVDAFRRIARSFRWR